MLVDVGGLAGDQATLFERDKGRGFLIGGDAIRPDQCGEIDFGLTDDGHAVLRVIGGVDRCIQDGDCTLRSVCSGNIQPFIFTAAKAHRDQETVAWGKIGRSVRNGEIHLAGEGHADRGSADDHAFGIFDFEGAEVGGWLDADGCINARLGGRACRNSSDCAVAGVARCCRACGRAASTTW